jgi:hypothetical protein
VEAVGEPLMGAGESESVHALEILGELHCVWKSTLKGSGAGAYRGCGHDSGEGRAVGGLNSPFSLVLDPKSGFSDDNMSFLWYQLS